MKYTHLLSINRKNIRWFIIFNSPDIQFHLHIIAYFSLMTHTPDVTKDYVKDFESSRLIISPLSQNTKLETVIYIKISLFKTPIKQCSLVKQITNFFMHVTQEIDVGGTAVVSTIFHQESP